MKIIIFIVIISCMMTGCRPRLNQEEKASATEMWEANGKKDFVGEKSPDFSLPDPQGNTITLSKLPDDRYILLDFWGSWCSWCIAEFPEMKRYYEKYRSRIEFIGIDVGDSPGKWKRAIEQYGLPWMHVRDYYTDDPWHSAVFAFGVSAYPTTIILSPDKTVLYVFKGESPQLYETLDELFE